MSDKGVRIEHDFIGEKEISNECYYGVQTLRAVENFNISGIKIYHTPPLIRSFAQVKKATAMANMELGILDKKIGEAIMAACDDIIAGKLLDQFIVDVIQGGAGTSTNMNANEVIANRALEILGHDKGRYDIVHPNNHVNLSQSTNDAYPTAIKLALHFQLSNLNRAIKQLQEAFEAKAEEFKDVYKMGRTQLQDAVPMTLGQEFASFAASFDDILDRVTVDQDLILALNMGATAIGTGINSPEGFAELVTKNLRELTGIPVYKAKNLIEATWDTNAFLQISSVTKQIAVKLSKICNDLRLLASGPRAGLNEINLPQLQPGSSIMPGKVNPVIPEVVNQVAFKVIGADVANTMACEAGQLQLNVMEPVIAFNLFHGIYMLKNACLTLVEKCVKGITVNRNVCADFVHRSVSLVTALNPIIGYEASAAIAKEALSTGRSIHEIVLERNLMSKEDVEKALSPENMIMPQVNRG
jgi:aspartate ammonia-lyase